jgi:hypothetical protein
MGHQKWPTRQVGTGGGAAATAISGLANSETTYTSGTVLLSALAGLTIRSTTGQAFQFSVPAAGGAQTAISGLQNSETTYTSGTVQLSVVGGALTIRSTTGQAFQFSISQSVQAETQTFLAGLQNSETTYTSGTVNLSVNGGPMTIRSTTGQAYQFSIRNYGFGVSTAGNTAGNTGTFGVSQLQFIGSNNITLSQDTAANAVSITISGPNTVAQTNQSAIKGFGASNTGNTAGNTGISTGIDWVVAGSNNVTISESTVGGGPNTIWVSGANAGAAAYSIGVSTGGNTAGSTGVTGTRIVFVGTDNISLSQSTDATGATISIRNMFSTATTVSSVSSANAVGANNSRFALEAHIHEGVRRLGISDGNTAGTTGLFPGSNIKLAGTRGIVLSQSTDAQSNNSITFDGQMGTLSHTLVWPFQVNTSTATQGNGTVWVNPWHMPAFFSASRFWQAYSLTLSTSSNSSHGGTVSVHLGVYTLNGSTLSLATSGRGTHVFTNTSNNSTSVLQGPFKFSGTFANLSMTPGDYWLAWMSQTSTVNANWFSGSAIMWSGAAAVSGDFGVATNVSNVQLLVGSGRFTASSTAMPVSMALTDISGASNAATRQLPLIGMANFST